MLGNNKGTAMRLASTKLNIGLLTFCAGVLFGLPSPAFLPADGTSLNLVQRAYADDDDGGDDGDGGGGTAAAGSGNVGNPVSSSKTGEFSKKPNKFFKPKKKTKVLKQNRFKVRPVKLKKATAEKKSIRPISAPDQLVLRDASDSDLNLLKQRGFTFISRTQGYAGKWTAKLRIPKKFTLRRARADAQKLVPNAKIDFNHFYRNGYEIQSGGLCDQNNCKSYELVKWTASLQDCKIVPVLGIVDTAIDLKHPALQGVDLNTIGEGIENASLDTSHGTAVAALIVGKSNGVSPGLIPRVKIKTMNVFEKSQKDDLRTDAFALANAIETMARESVWLVNMSVAGPENVVLENAVTQYSKQGGLLIAAAGNYGPAAPPAYPAAYETVIAVAAIGENLDVYKRSNRGKHIDLAAPGVNIRSAGKRNSVEIFSGTSFAAPFVTAAAAVMLSNGQNKADVVALLKGNAIDLGAKGPDAKFGAGLVQFNDTCDKSN
jgi:minor extracellular protease Epr